MANEQFLYNAVYGSNAFMESKDTEGENTTSVKSFHNPPINNLPALQEGAVPVMFALLDARSMTCG